MPDLRRTLLLTVALGLLGLVFLTSAFGNLHGMLTTKNWPIPEGSSVFQFRALVVQAGAEGGWLYGEDGEKYYYRGVSPYVAIAKNNDCSEFSPTDFRTWCEADISDQETNR